MSVPARMEGFTSKKKKKANEARSYCFLFFFLCVVCVCVVDIVLSFLVSCLLFWGGEGGGHVLFFLDPVNKAKGPPNHSLREA